MGLPVNANERDFRLILRADPDTREFCVAFYRCGGEGPNELLIQERTPPLPASFETDYLRPLANFIRDPLPGDLLHDLGRELAARLLPEEIRARLLAVKSPGSTRLRLTLHPSHTPLQLPWEYAYLDPDTSGLMPHGFLCRLPTFHLIRQTDTMHPVAPISANPLNVLVVSADPQADGYGALPFLEKEQDAIEQAFNSGLSGRVMLDMLKDAGPIGLKRGLRSSKMPPHILHFIGHGKADRDGSALILQGEGGAVRVPASELAGWLRGTSIRLVVLSACHTAAAHGIAQTLTQQGVPAVVAMQLPWRDSAAAPFARSFYGALAQQSSVEEALHEARQVLTSGPDWGVPTLYLAGDSSALFFHSTAPVVLPAGRNPTFVGYEAELESLHDKLYHSPEKCAAIIGMPGIGKTELAQQYAHTHLQDYRGGGIFYIDARSTNSLLDSYADLGRRYFRAADLKDQSPRDLGLWTRDRLQEVEHPALIIYDNLEEDTDRSWLPAFGQARILITTRDLFVKSQFHTVD